MSATSACSPPRSEVGDDVVEGYHIHVGGGAGAEQKLAREIFRSVVFAEVPGRIERLLKTYLEHRRDAESFHSFTGRHSVDELTGLIDQAA